MYHQCAIGYYYEDDKGLVTLDELKDIIKERKEDNISIKKSGFNDVEWMYKKEYTLSDYADRRKATGFFKFDYCPFCGKKINWKKIKQDGE